MSPSSEPKAASAPAIGTELAHELAKYKGQWVAVDQAHKVVVGTGRSAAEAIANALEKGFTDPLVFRVATQARRVRIR